MALTVVALRRADPRIAVGLLGLALAAGVRMAVAGASGAASIPGGVVFAAFVAVVAALTRGGAWSRPRVASVATGVAGAIALCVPAALRHAADGMALSSVHGYAPWALAVVAVASAEEALLRGSLFRAVEQRAGVVAAIALTSVAFALLHVPLYGWAVVPLDLAVGVWLGVLRAVSGSVLAPAVAHSLADLAGWWLR